MRQCSPQHLATLFQVNSVVRFKNPEGLRADVPVLTVYLCIFPLFFFFLMKPPTRLTQDLLRNVHNKVLPIVSYSRAGKSPEAPFVTYDSNLPQYVG